MSAPAVVTCSLSLTRPGLCCADGGHDEQADVAVLLDYGRSFCEHAWCIEHVMEAQSGEYPAAQEDGVIVATKPYHLSPVWGPSGKGRCRRY